MKPSSLFTPLAAIALGSLLAGCPKPIPEHLRVNPAPTKAAELESFEEMGSLVRFMMRADPLVRSPKLPAEERLKGVPQSFPIRDWLETVKKLERGEGDPARNLQQMEDTHAGSVVVPFSRGYRMQVGENILANLNDDQEQRNSKLLELWTPLAPAQDGASLTRPALGWLHAEDTPQLRSWAERWVLLGWLDHPQIPLQPASDALKARMYDGLQQTPVGRLILARTSKEPVPPDPKGAESLKVATDLALERAAADRDSEQDAFSTLLADYRKKEGSKDPVQSLLKTAKNALIKGSQSNEEAGLALIAIAAERWRDQCEVKPCAGMDRVDSFRVAQSWGTKPKAEAAIWRVITLKESIDSMDVGHSTVMFPAAVDRLTDALLGTGGGPLPNDLLRRRRPDAGTWLALARGAGVEGVTDWAAAQQALGGHLAREVDQAIALTSDPRRLELLNRIKKRALP